jgi:predicted amidophosphoribosyltransferase
MKIFFHFINSIFPEPCPTCHCRFTGLFQCLCDSCQKKAYDLFKIKSVSREQIALDKIAENRNFFFARLHYLSTYQSFEKSLYEQAKFTDNRNSKSLLAAILLEKIAQSNIFQSYNYNYLVPAPSSKGIIKYFIKIISKELNIPVLNIIRKNEKVENKKLNRFDRFFQIDRSISLINHNVSFNTDTRILVFDDLWTTGATLNSICRLLASNGATPDNIDCLALFLRLMKQVK